MEQNNSPNKKLKNDDLIFFTNLYLPSHYYSNPSPHTNSQQLNNLLNQPTTFSFSLPHHHTNTPTNIYPTILINYNPQTQQPTIITTYITPHNINPNTHYYPTISHNQPNIYLPQ